MGQSGLWVYTKICYPPMLQQHKMWGKNTLKESNILLMWIHPVKQKKKNAAVWLKTQFAKMPGYNYLFSLVCKIALTRSACKGNIPAWDLDKTAFQLLLPTSQSCTNLLNTLNRHSEVRENTWKNIIMPMAMRPCTIYKVMKITSGTTSTEKLHSK